MSCLIIFYHHPILSSFEVLLPNTQTKQWQGSLSLCIAPWNGMVLPYALVWGKIPKAEAMSWEHLYRHLSPSWGHFEPWYNGRLGLISSTGPDIFPVPAQRLSSLLEGKSSQTGMEGPKIQLSQISIIEKQVGSLPPFPWVIGLFLFVCWFSRFGGHIRQCPWITPCSMLSDHFRQCLKYHLQCQEIKSGWTLCKANTLTSSLSLLSIKESFGFGGSIKSENPLSNIYVGIQFFKAQGEREWEGERERIQLAECIFCTYKTQVWSLIKPISVITKQKTFKRNHKNRTGKLPQKLRQSPCIPWALVQMPSTTYGSKAPPGVASKSVSGIAQVGKHVSPPPSQITILI